MSTPTTPVQSEPTPEPTPEVVATAEKFVRAKTLVKKTFTRVGVPVLIGTAAAYVVSRRSDDKYETVEEPILTEE